MRLHDVPIISLGNRLFKTIRSPESITSIIFSPDGAAIYIGMRDGLRILNLRELDKEMKRISVAEVGEEVVCLAVQVCIPIPVALGI